MVMKYYTKEELKVYNTLEEVWTKVYKDNFDFVTGGNTKHPNATINRKKHFLKYLPERGSHREVGAHQGLNIARVLIDYKASYVDSFDITNKYINILMPYFDEYCKRNNVKLDFAVTSGEPKLSQTAKMVDTVWIDACKRGFWVHAMLKECAKTTRYAIGVDDLVSSQDICKGVDAFLKEQNEWILEYEDRTNYPGIAVLVKNENL